MHVSIALQLDTYASCAACMQMPVHLARIGGHVGSPASSCLALGIPGCSLYASTVTAVHSPAAAAAAAAAQVLESLLHVMDALAAMLAEMPRPSTHKAVATRWVSHTLSAALLPARPPGRLLSTAAPNGTQMQMGVLRCAQLRVHLPPNVPLVPAYFTPAHPAGSSRPPCPSWT